MELLAINKDILLYIILGVGLLICTITDLKNRVIYLSVIIAELLLLSGFHIWQESFLVVNITGQLKVLY